MKLSNFKVQAVVELNGVPVTVDLTLDIWGLAQTLAAKAAASSRGRAAFAQGLIWAKLSKADHVAVIAHAKDES